MGISGLLPMLKPACKPSHVSQFRGKTFAIDVYCFLHKGAFGCAEQLVQGKPTDGYVKYVMKYVSLLLNYDIKPILVFDGRNLPSKEETEKKRRAARKENREKAVQMLQQGRGREAKEYFQRSVDITPEMALNTIKAARGRNVDCIVAPYEADAQLAYLAMAGIADVVVTEDSDLTLFGCERILFKLVDSGDCVLYEREALGRVFGLQADHFSFDKFRYMCITAGCDYLTSLPGIGLGKAKNFWAKVTNPDLRNVLRKIPAYLKMPQVCVSQDYVEKFIRANNTFLYQLVFDPVSRTERPVTPYPSTMTEAVSSLTYCGSYSAPPLALQMALGNVNIFTKATVDSFDPDLSLLDSSSSGDPPKYGVRAAHRSMWEPDFLEKGPMRKSIDPEKSKMGFAFQMSSSQVDKMSTLSTSSPVARPRPVSKGVEKRKAEVSEDKVEEMLLADDNEEDSPPKKKLKGADLEKMKKIVGLEHKDKKNIVVSKYFSRPAATDQVTKVASENTVPRGRRTSTGDGGAWFREIEKPTSAEGKFIYRPDKDNPDGEGKNVLQEISNSPDKETENRERLQRRNPFAKSLNVAKESVDLGRSLKEDSSGNESSLTIPSSQLSLNSIDGESLTFSSQSLDPIADSPSVESETPSSSPVSSSQASAAPPTSCLRVGLSKFKRSSPQSPPPPVRPQSSLSQMSQSRPTQKTLGLSRSGAKAAAGDAKKQPSILAMFARSCPQQANIGK